MTYISVHIPLHLLGVRKRIGAVVRSVSAHSSTAGTRRLNAHQNNKGTDDKLFLAVLASSNSTRDLSSSGAVSSTLTLFCGGNKPAPLWHSRLPTPSTTTTEGHSLRGNERLLTKCARGKLSALGLEAIQLEGSTLVIHHVAHFLQTQFGLRIFLSPV